MNHVLNSYWEVQLKPNLIDNGSDKLVVILPGIAYTIDRVTIEYSGELALSQNYDLMEIEYGFQVARKGFNVEEEFNIIADETLELVKDALNLKKYKEIIIIGKSIGTCVQDFLNEKIEEINIKNIYISPIDKTVGMGFKEGSLIITGSKDPLLSEENLQNIVDSKKYKVMIFNGANHALNLEKDPIGSLEIQIEIIKAIKTFIK
ncbi:alpha/beta hydrolase [Clostridium chrysemydis]|uniref:alpha/beta hydrolase n=1 Tax=Clostridium chrysemydis TaxID=2665504 RepID=UPI001883FC28|nr:alpha/beta hydrolase [Clostridium chrysemydis]